MAPMSSIVPVSYEDDLFAARVAPRAMEISPDALMIVSKFGEIRAVNSAMVRLTGWPRTELLHQQVEVLVPEDLRERHIVMREQYMLQPVDRPMGQGIKVELMHQNGTLVPVEILLGVMEADDLYIVATIRRVGTE